MKRHIYTLIVSFLVLFIPVNSIAGVLKITLSEPGTLANFTKSDEAKEADSLIICGNVQLSNSDFLALKKLLVSYNLKYIDIYDTSNTTIGEEVFMSCINLHGFKFPKNLKSVGRYCFENCYNLEYIILPESLENFGAGAFRSCSIKEVTIPEKVTIIEDQVFMYCPLQNVYSKAKTPPVCTVEAFMSNNNRDVFAILHVPSGTKELYENADGWMYFPFTTESDNEIYKIVYSVIGNGKIKINNKIYSGNNNIYVEKNSDINFEIIPETGYKISEVYYLINNIGDPIDVSNNVRNGLLTYKSVQNNIYFYFLFEKDDSTGKKCETPTISFVDGKLTFSCATEEVEYVSEVTCSDVNKYYSNEINLAACYDITVTAMKTGYDNSDVATAKLYWLTSSGSLEGDNINNVSMRGIAIQSAGGFVTISGLDNNETVSFYGIDGKSLGSATAINGTTSFAAQSGSVVVAKIGKESIKIAVK